MKIFIRTLIVCMFLAAGAIAQTPGPACRPSQDELSVHQKLLTHFQIVEGTVLVRSFDKAQPDEFKDPAIGQAVVDFNRRNAEPCAATPVPLPDLQLIAGPHKTRLSRIGLDAPGTTAFAEITMIGGPEIGSSHFVVLKMKEGAWTVIEDRLYRIF